MGQIVSEEREKKGKWLPHAGGLIGLIFTIVWFLFLVSVTFFVEITPAIFKSNWLWQGFIIASIPLIIDAIRYLFQFLLGTVQLIHLLNSIGSVVSAGSFYALYSIYPFQFDGYIKSRISDPDLQAQDFDLYSGYFFIFLTVVLLISALSEIYKFFNWDTSKRKSLLLD